MHAVIMAGGKGTRLGSIAADIPKPMVCLQEKPILLHQIENLKRCGITNIFLIVGHLGHKIREYFRSGEEFGVKIDYIEEQSPLGTAGALYYLKDCIDDDFLLLYGDIFTDVDFIRFLRFHKEKQAIATLFVHPNSHPYDSDLVVCSPSGRVIGWDSKNTNRDYDYKNCVNGALYVFSDKVLSRITTLSKLDLEKDIILPLIKTESNVYAYKSTEYVKDMGTPERLDSVEKDFKNGVCHARNLMNLQKCIFLDRDGTINQHIGFLTKPEQVELLDKSAEAIALINKSSYLCIVVTNQPVLARGECKVEELNAIHMRLETLLGKMGAYLDDLYYCPHHPDKGYEGERSELKIKCNCRKPNIGMIQAAVVKYNINIAESYIIGDTTIDVQTGKNAGLQTVLVRTGEGGKDGKFVVKPDAIYENLMEAVKDILNENP